MGAAMMPFSEIRAQAWKFATIGLSVAAVALLVWCLFLRNSAYRANVRADAESARAQAAETALRQVNKAEAVNADATATARTSADTRKAKQATDTARVKGYADSVSDDCSASPDILRELQAKADGIRAAEGGLRDLRRTDK